MNEHPFIYLEDCFGEKVKIDKKISELLKLIWNLDLYTLNSCQENKPGKIWIHFIDTDNAERFLKLILSDNFKHKNDNSISRFNRMERETIFRPNQKRN